MSEATATLHIGGWYSRCGACNRNADPAEETHVMAVMEGDGCGARFVAVAADYPDHADSVAAMRPDLPYTGLRWPEAQVTP